MADAIHPADSDDCERTPVAEVRRHRRRRIALIAVLMLAVGLSVALSFATYLRQGPVYQATARLRIEERSMGCFRPAKPGPYKKEWVEYCEPEEQDQPEPISPVGQRYSRMASNVVELALLKAETQALEEEWNSREIKVDEDAVETEALADQQVQKLSEVVSIQEQRLKQLLADESEGASGARYKAYFQRSLETERMRNELLDGLRESIRAKKTETIEKKREDLLAKASKQITNKQGEIDRLRKEMFQQQDPPHPFHFKFLDSKSLELELQREQYVVDLFSAEMMRLRSAMSLPAFVELLRKAERPEESLPRDFFSQQTHKKSKQTDRELFEENSESWSGWFLATQAVVIRSRFLLERVLRRPELAKYPPLQENPQPVNWLQERIHFQFQEDSDLLIINFTCADPEYAAIITNAIVESYLQLHSQDENQRATRVVDLLEDERAQRMVVIQQLQEQVKEMSPRALGRDGDSSLLND